MASFAQELVTVQRERLDLKAGLVGLVILSVFGVAIALVGPVVMAAAIGALVLLSTDLPPAGRSWATALLPLIRRSSGARWGRSPSCVASASGSPSCSASPGSRRIPHGSPSAP